MTTLPSQGVLQVPLLRVLADAGGEASSTHVQDRLAEAFDLSPSAREDSVEVASGKFVNRWDRHVRWTQQRARLAGLTVSRAPGIWRLSPAGKDALGSQEPGTVTTVALTQHGILIWAHAEDLAHILEDCSIQLLCTSPPYPLNTRKPYANQHPARTHVSWLLGMLGRYLRKMVPHGSIALNVGPTWQPGQPTHTTWMERLVIALEDELGLHLCQTLYWENPSKLPGPAEWTNRRRVRLTDRIERILWFSPTPNPFADNTAVLIPYSPRFQEVLEAGGERGQVRPSGHAFREGSFSRNNGGAIPGTLLRLPNTASNDAYTRRCRTAGVPIHPARFPLALPDFLIRFLTREDDLVVDPLCGSARTARAAERLKRRWICGDIARAYLCGATFNLDDLAGYQAAG
jgi:DNA modification methylase